VSYDVSIGEEWFNYTSNMREFFIAFGAYPMDWNGAAAKEVEISITYALQAIATHPTSYLQEFSADNGWGSWESALYWLWEIRDAVGRADPNQKIEVTA